MVTKKCPRTGKKRYPNEQMANNQLNLIKKHSTRNQIPTRTYECEFCHGYHLTKRDDRKPIETKLKFNNQFQKLIQDGKEKEEDRTD